MNVDAGIKILLYSKFVEPLFNWVPEAEAVTKGGDMKSEIVVGFPGNAGNMEELRKLLSQLHAMTMMVSGEGTENFCLHNEEIKSAYIWAMSDVVSRALKLTDKVAGRE
jgi:hypothetical protein